MESVSRQRYLAKKHLQDLLREQNIELSDTFLVEPTRREAVSVLKAFVRVILGCSININSQDQLRLFIIEHLMKVRSGSLSYDWTKGKLFFPLLNLAAGDLDVNYYLPNNGEKHVQSVDLMALYRCLQKVGTICGIDNVNLEDVLQPTGSRMLVYASAVADFLQFQEKHMSDVYLKWSKIQEDRRLVALIKEETQLLQDKLEAIGSQTEKQRLQLQDYIREERQKSDTLKALATEVRTCREQLKTEEQQSALATEKLKTAEKQIVSLQSELAALLDQVVESPRRVTQTLHETASQIETTENQLAELKQLIPQIQLSKDVYKVLIPRCDAACESFKAIEAASQELAKYQAAIEKVSVCFGKVDSEVQRIKNENKEVQSKLDEALLAYSAACEKTTRTEQKLQSLRESRQRTKAEHEERLQSQRAAIAAMKQQLGASNKAAADFASEMASAQESHALEMEKMTASVKRFSEELTLKLKRVDETFRKGRGSFRRPK